MAWPADIRSRASSELLPNNTMPFEHPAFVAWQITLTFQARTFQVSQPTCLIKHSFVNQKKPSMTGLSSTVIMDWQLLQTSHLRWWAWSTGCSCTVCWRDLCTAVTAWEVVQTNVVCQHHWAACLQGMVMTCLQSSLKSMKHWMKLVVVTHHVGEHAVPSNVCSLPTLDTSNWYNVWQTG